MLGVRVTGERAGDVESLLSPGNVLEVLERMAREPVEIRKAAQRFTLSLRLLREPALAVDEPAEIGVANGDLHAHPARVLADGKRQVGVAVAEPLLPAGPTGMEREVRTSPMRFIGFPAALR